MNKNDNINKNQLKALFDDFEADIPTGSWDRLEESLGARSRAVIVRRNWFIGSAAAIAVLLISSILFVNGPKQADTPLMSETTTNGNKLQGNTNSVIVTSEEVSENKKDTETQLIAQDTQGTKNKPNVVEQFTFVFDDSEVEVPSQPYSPPATIKEDNSNENDVDTDNKPTKEELDRLIKDLENSANVDIFNESDIAKRNNRPLMLALNAKGGLTSSEKKSNSPMSLRSANTYQSSPKDDILGDGTSSEIISEGIGGLFPNNNTVDNEAEMIHSQPYSVGITVSKSVTDRLSVETGLVYTYLHSEAKNTSSLHRDRETQEIHYLGIPVNLNYNFLELGRFNLFSTIGGMIEKDVHGVHRYDASSTNQQLNIKSERKDSEKINLKNPQFSINAGIGASYAIYRGINIYAKIGGAYYFNAKNNEYRTIYSDQKILLDINAGLRFQF